MRHLLLAAALLLSAKSPIAKDGDVPRQPSRRDIADAMQRITPAVAACRPGFEETVHVRMVFRSDGSVIEAQITGETSLSLDRRQCVLRAARRARVRPFSVPRFSVNYPFRFG